MHIVFLLESAMLDGRVFFIPNSSHPCFYFYCHQSDFENDASLCNLSSFFLNMQPCVLVSRQRVLTLPQFPSAQLAWAPSRYQWVCCLLMAVIASYPEGNQLPMFFFSFYYLVQFCSMRETTVGKTIKMIRILYNELSCVTCSKKQAVNALKEIQRNLVDVLSIWLSKQFFHGFKIHLISKPKKANTQNYFMTFKVMGYIYSQISRKIKCFKRNELQ